jgi:hypothetical protein
MLLLRVQGFLSAQQDFKGMDIAAEGQEEYKQLSKCMDPVVSTFANFHSEEHLTYMISRLFESLDVDDQGFITYEDMRNGLQKLDIEPRIKLSAEDFDEFTRHREYVDISGYVSRDNFEKCMRLELKRYAFRIATHQMNEAVRADMGTTNDYMYEKVRDAIDAIAVCFVSLRFHDTCWYVQVVMREVFYVSEKMSELEAGLAIDSKAPPQSPAAATRSALSDGGPVPTPQESPKESPATEPVTCRCGCDGATCCFQAVINQV